MRIHTKLSPMHVIHAVQSIPDSTVSIARITLHQSRTHAYGIELQLFGSGRTGGQWGTVDGKAATWDEWGMALARIYALDHTARVAGAYDSADHFRWATCNRFGGWDYTTENGGNFIPSDLTPTTQHRTHKWVYEGVALGGSYSVSQCARCDARTRRLIRSTWTDFEVNA